MSYIDNNLLSEERIVFRTKKHLIIFFVPILLTFAAILASFYMKDNYVLVKFIWAPWMIALLFWSYSGVDYLFSEYAVTNKRVMMREGVFNRHANEMRLTAISQVNVDQNIIGQMLNFGIVSINAFGAFDSYALIASPSAFQRAVNEQLDKASK